ncbi:siderophore ferric iron reductase, AHA_1954 family [Devosia lucknowensis]|uniref:Siderophore ferric iron reductase, AHA_1954 family n=1 Tax=Devosia lucknowensis TaxID=1096929 RepID=A0A1Y6G6D6_9HYPH|nr:siderophore ferric iron reductase [Devosia lucknowensis]SMQ85646.1 siderophore ferric iron reductase, AHA_1954 family [Devosia lucknowensis]
MTARNYLFAPTADDAALTRFIALGASATGFLKGAPGGHLPGWHTPGQDNTEFLTTLYQRLEASYPHAGQPFYAVRLWTNLMWQPAYLAVIAVHLFGALPDVTTLSQARQNIDINGYRLRPGPMVEGDLEVLIARAGQDLRRMGDAVLAEINGVTKLKRVPALRLLTDRMLGLMVRLNHYRPGMGVDEQKRLCGLWLKAMGLTGQGDLEILTLHDGKQVAITARKGCCLDYLAFPGTYCASCPKQDDALRLARQTADAVAELAAAS